MSRQRKRTYATATQASASNMDGLFLALTLSLSQLRLSLGDFRHRGMDVALRRGRAEKALDNGRRRIRGDATDIAHGGAAGCGDRLLGRRQLLVQLRLELLVDGIRLRGLLLAGLVGDRLRPGAGIGERLLIGRIGRFRLLLEALRRRQIVSDALRAVSQD